MKNYLWLLIAIHLVDSQYVFLHTCSFLQPSHDEQIFFLPSSSYHMLSDNTCPSSYLALGPEHVDTLCTHNVLTARMYSKTS